MKTFSSLTLQELSAYNPFGYKSSPKYVETSEVMDVARGIANGLKKKFNAKKVVLFGSLATLEFVEGSDIDIAVWGIPYNKINPEKIEVLVKKLPNALMKINNEIEALSIYLQNLKIPANNNGE